MNLGAWYATVVFSVGPPRNRHLTFEQLETRLPMSAVGLGQPHLVPPPQVSEGAAIAAAPQNSTTTAIVDTRLLALYNGTLTDPSRLLFDSAGRVGVAVESTDITTLLPTLEALGFQPAVNSHQPWLVGYAGYLPVQSIGQMASLGPDGLMEIDARLAPFVEPTLKQLANETAIDTSRLLFDAQGRVGVSVFGYDMQTLSTKLQAVGFQPLANPDQPWFGPGVSGYLPIDAIDQVASWADYGLMMFTARYAPGVSSNLVRLAAGEKPSSDQLMFDSAGRVAVSINAYDSRQLDPVLASLGFVPLKNPNLPGQLGESGYLPVAAVKQFILLADNGLFMLEARYKAGIDSTLSRLADGQTANTSGLVFDSSGRVGVFIESGDYERLLPTLEQVGFVPGDPKGRGFPGEPGFLPVSALNDLELLTDNGLLGIFAQYAPPEAAPPSAGTAMRSAAQATPNDSTPTAGSVDGQLVSKTNDAQPSPSGVSNAATLDPRNDFSIASTPTVSVSGVKDRGVRDPSLV